MGYGLGVDLGSSFTTAAAGTTEGVEVVALGDRSIAAPSVVLAGDDGHLVCGEAAEWQAGVDPSRMAREVKRRLGDPTPLILARRSYLPTELMAAQLAEVVRSVSAFQRGEPSRILLTYPAVWGPYRCQQLAEVARLAALEDVQLVTEAEAAAVHYTRTGAVPEGALVLVYDLGGTTCDTTILRTGAEGARIVGSPEGIDHLGGADFDQAILDLVDRRLGGAVARLASDQPSAGPLLVQLGRNCVLAKEALSVELETTVPVHLPNGHHQVPLTRHDLEDLLRPMVRTTLGVVRRALESAGLAPSDLAAILLAGGSSRIRLVAGMISAEFGTQLRTDAHPEHAVALGAAALATVPERRSPARVLGNHPRPALAAGRRRAEDRPGDARGRRPRHRRVAALRATPTARQSALSLGLLLGVVAVLVSLLPLGIGSALSPSLGLGNQPGSTPGPASGSARSSLPPMPVNLPPPVESRRPAPGADDQAKLPRPGSAARRIVGFNGRCVDVPWSTAVDGQHLHMWTCNGSRAQAWTFGADWRVRAYGKCMSLARGSTENGTPIQLARCSDSPLQQFVLNSAGDLVNLSADKCVDVKDLDPRNGARLQLWQCSGSANQKWRRE